MKKIFCKHNYCLYLAESDERCREIDDEREVVEKMVGCAIVCSKCGKQKTRLGKKVAQYYANAKIIPFKERAEKIYIKHKIKDWEELNTRLKDELNELNQK